jgi:CxxC-x17-CxxC domain-containing protein
VRFDIIADRGSNSLPNSLTVSRHKPKIAKSAIREGLRKLPGSFCHTCLKEGTTVAFEDKSLTCRDCEGTFVFTAGEQGFYLEKGLLNEPQRCPICRASRRKERTANGGREQTTVTCAECGGQATVPFVPRYDRPVYCSGCFEAARAAVVG